LDLEEKAVAKSQIQASQLNGTCQREESASAWKKFEVKKCEESMGTGFLALNLIGNSIRVE
jgi:hypothetical protein